MLRPPPRSTPGRTLFPYTTLFRSKNTSRTKHSRRNSLHTSKKKDTHCTDKHTLGEKFKERDRDEAFGHRHMSAAVTLVYLTDPDRAANELFTTSLRTHVLKSRPVLLLLYWTATAAWRKWEWRGTEGAKKTLERQRETDGEWEKTEAKEKKGKDRKNKEGKSEVIKNEEKNRKRK